jgi:hypothetical protein
VKSVVWCSIQRQQQNQTMNKIIDLEEVRSCSDDITVTISLESLLRKLTHKQLTILFSEYLRLMTLSTLSDPPPVETGKPDAPTG